MTLRRLNLRICISTWSLQLRENEDFNVEEKESELIEQQRLQLKRNKGLENVEREISKGELRKQKNRELQGYTEKSSREGDSFSAETEEQREVRRSG